MSQAEALALWRRHKATGDTRLRDRLIMTYAPLVKYIVYRKIREVPSHQEAEDYISHGLEALIMSIDRYDPSKGATLEQFLWTRIHGAVLDELRRQDWAPRSLRRWERDIARAREQFSTIHGRRPSREELADALAAVADGASAAYDELRERWLDRLLGDGRAPRPSSYHAAYLFRLTPLGDQHFQVMVIETDAQGHWLKRMDAADGVYADHAWTLSDVSINAPGGPTGLRYAHRDSLRVASTVGPGTASPPEPRQMQLFELGAYARNLQRAGMDASNYVFTFQRKLAGPLTVGHLVTSSVQIGKLVSRLKPEHHEALRWERDLAAAPPPQPAANLVQLSSEKPESKAAVGD